MLFALHSAMPGIYHGIYLYISSIKANTNVSNICSPSLKLGRLRAYMLGSMALLVSPLNFLWLSCTLCGALTGGEIDQKCKYPWSRKLLMVIETQILSISA